jgi:hypothetical protein
MYQSIAKSQIEANLTSRFGPVFKIGEKPAADFLSSGLRSIDTLTGGGLPRGAITEITGSASSGRMSVLVASLSNATIRSESCVVIDASNTFDPQSVGTAGVDFNRVLWVRCNSSVERAFKATDLVLQSGGFGLVALNLTGVAANYARRIISSWWFRFRRAIENTPTALLVLSPVCCVRSCASIILEAKDIKATFASTVPLQSSTRVNPPSRKGFKIALVEDPRRRNETSSPTHSQLLTGTEVEIKLLKPTTWAHDIIQFEHIA